MAPPRRPRPRSSCGSSTRTIALGGAGLTLTGLAVLLPGLLGWLANSSNFITFILTIVLAAIGFGARYRTMAGRSTYAAMRA